MPTTFARTYTDEQRAAIRRAIVENGLNASQAVEHAAAGTLKRGLAPFAMPLSTARNLAQRERRKRSRATLLTNGATLTLDATAADLAVMLATIRAKAKRSGATAENVEQIARAARAVAALQRDLNAMRPTNPPSPTDSEPDEPTTSRTLAEQIAREQPSPTV